jgi:hypothetical protein
LLLFIFALHKIPGEIGPGEDHPDSRTIQSRRSRHRLLARIMVKFFLPRPNCGNVQEVF